jgi:hypothetical protein
MSVCYLSACLSICLSFCLLSLRLAVCLTVCHVSFSLIYLSYTYTRALFVSPNRRHLFVTPWFYTCAEPLTTDKLGRLELLWQWTPQFGLKLHSGPEVKDMDAFRFTAKFRVLESPLFFSKSVRKTERATKEGEIVNFFLLLFTGRNNMRLRHHGQCLELSQVPFRGGGGGGIANTTADSRNAPCKATLFYSHTGLVACMGLLPSWSHALCPVPLPRYNTGTPWHRHMTSLVHSHTPANTSASLTVYRTYEESCRKGGGREGCPVSQHKPMLGKLKVWLWDWN